MENHSEYYDENYYNWQKIHGEFGGKANKFKFSESIKETDVVIDFGCGGGYLLKNFDCFKKIGIEPNKNAHNQILENGSTPFASPQEALKDLGENYADVIISNNCLEHTLNPLEELKSLFPLLKSGGIIHFIIPCDSIRWNYDPNDINYHLYSWSPMNAGNIFNEAGFQIIYSKAYMHKWPPGYRSISKLGWPIFNFISKMYAYIQNPILSKPTNRWNQVAVKAKKP